MTTAFRDDWARTCANPVLHRTAEVWAEAEPALAGLSLDTIMCLAQGTNAGLGGVDTDQGDLVLGALCRLAVGCTLARRTALQAVLPRLVHAARSMARRDAGVQVRDLTSDLAALAWEELACSADRWPAHVAARLVTQVERRHLRGLRHQLCEQPVADPALVFQPGGGTDLVEVDRVDLAQLLSSAVDRGLLRPEAARILEHVAFDGLTDAQIAAARGGTAAGAKKARQRAVAAMRAHRSTLGLRAG